MTTTPIAIALEYDEIDAPTVIASATGGLAEKIINTAKAHDVPLHEDTVLVELLAQLELGEDIPPPLYTAVAEVIAFAYLLKNKYPNGHNYHSYAATHGTQDEFNENT